ncbi:MAG: hypothetical protein IJT23_10650 [Clostridia bacterium]|nr:hypothetical protein [Clostridia bacterium]
MAREARKLSSKGLYYIELNGDNLFNDDVDKKKFIELITNYFKDGGKIFAYSLTKTKIKMVVKESKKGISMTMKPITVSYARYFNKKYDLTGSIFHGRFLSIPYETKKEADEAAKAVTEDVEVNKPIKKETKPAPKKTVTKKEAPKKTVKGPAPKKEPEKETKEEVKKPKKKNLPTWLL